METGVQYLKWCVLALFYGVRIISITNMKGGFIISDTLQSIDAYQIPNNIIRSSDRNIIFILSYLQSSHHTVFRAICLNHSAYIYGISHLAVGSRRQIYSNDHHNPNNITIDPVLFSRDYVNNYTNVTSP